MVDITTELIAFDTDNRVNGPWGVSVSSERMVLTMGDQAIEMTQVRGFIHCPDKATAEEIAARLAGDRG